MSLFKICGSSGSAFGLLSTRQGGNWNSQGRRRRVDLFRMNAAGLERWYRKRRSHIERGIYHFELWRTYSWIVRPKVRPARTTFRVFFFFFFLLPCSKWKKTLRRWLVH